MKKIIIAASLLLIGTYQLQAKANVENTHTKNAIEILTTSNSSLIAAIITTGNIESLDITISNIENFSVNPADDNNNIAVLNMNEVFANRYKSLFWNEGRKIYA